MASSGTKTARARGLSIVPVALRDSSGDLLHLDPFDRSPLDGSVQALGFSLVHLRPLSRERKSEETIIYRPTAVLLTVEAIPLHQGTSWDDDLLSAIIPVQSTRYWDMAPMCVVCQEGKTSAVYKTGAASLPPPPYQFLLRLASTVCAGHPLAPKSTGR